jgi:hypothetical protein
MFDRCLNAVTGLDSMVQNGFTEPSFESNMTCLRFGSELTVLGSCTAVSIPRSSCSILTLANRNVTAQKLLWGWKNQLLIDQ